VMILLLLSISCCCSPSTVIFFFLSLSLSLSLSLCVRPCVITCYVESLSMTPLSSLLLRVNDDDRYFVVLRRAERIMFVTVESKIEKIFSSFRASA
jgi:hypothetical protein